VLVPEVETRQPKFSRTSFGNCFSWNPDRVLLGLCRMVVGEPVKKPLRSQPQSDQGGQNDAEFLGDPDVPEKLPSDQDGQVNNQDKHHQEGK
jgi:hypothetical protein